MVDMRLRCQYLVLLLSIWLACSSSPVAAAWLGPSTQSHLKAASAAVSAASVGVGGAVESPVQLAGEAAPAAVDVSGAAPTAPHRHRSRRLRPERHSHEHYSSHERKHGGHEHQHNDHERKHDHEHKHTHEPHKHHRHQDPTDTPDRRRQEEDYHDTSYSLDSSSYSHPDPSRQDYEHLGRPPYHEPGHEDTEGKGPHLRPYPDPVYQVPEPLQRPRAEWRGLAGAVPEQPRGSGSSSSSSRAPDSRPPSREQPGVTSPLLEQLQEPVQAGGHQQPELPPDGNKQPQGAQELPNLGAQELPNLGAQELPNLGAQELPNLGAPDLEQEDAWKDTPEQSQERHQPEQPDSSSSRQQQQQAGKEQDPELPDFEWKEVWTLGPKEPPAGDSQVPQQQQQQPPQPPQQAPQQQQQSPQQPQPAQHQVLGLQPDGTANQDVPKQPQDKPGQAQQPPAAQEVEGGEADPAFGDGHGHEKQPAQQPRGFGGGGSGYGYGYGYGAAGKQLIESVPRGKNTSTGQEPEGEIDPAFGDGHGNSKLPSGSAGDDPDGEGYGPYDKPKGRRDPQKRFAADSQEEFPDPTALTSPGTESLYGNDTVKQTPGNYGYWPVFKLPGGSGSEMPEGQDSGADFGGSLSPDDSDGSGGERRFGEPAPGEEAPKALNGSCRVGGSESNCQGSGVIIDNSTSAADGAVTAIADCVEELGNIYQKGGYCDLVCTDQADYKVVEKSIEKFKTGFDGQVTCEARRVTDSISINGICSLIPVATCCEPDNLDKGIVFAISQARRSRRGQKSPKHKRSYYQQ